MQPVLCRELNSMDVILHEVGEDLLLTRRKDLHAAHRLQHLPPLPAHEQQSHTEPMAEGNKESSGAPLHLLQAQCDFLYHSRPSPAHLPP